MLFQQFRRFCGLVAKTVAVGCVIVILFPKFVRISAPAQPVFESRQNQFLLVFLVVGYAFNASFLVLGAATFY
jgi:hypothetical protein